MKIIGDNELVITLPSTAGTPGRVLYIVNIGSHSYLLENGSSAINGASFNESIAANTALQLIANTSYGWFSIPYFLNDGDDA